MEILLCGYCSMGYDFNIRSPVSLNCGCTCCLNCYNYIIGLGKNLLCPFCNKPGEAVCYDMNIMDTFGNIYLCIWHNLPIEYINKEKAFACKACKEENPNLVYSPWSVRNLEKIREKMSSFNNEDDVEKDMIFVKKKLEDELKKNREKKDREIEKIIKEYKDNKAEIQKRLNILEKTLRKYSKNIKYFELQLKMIFVCLLTKENPQEEMLKQTQKGDECLSDRRIEMIGYLEFRKQSQVWKDLWNDSIFILFNSFSKMTTNFQVYIKKKLNFYVHESILEKKRPRSLLALGLCSPVDEKGFGEYTILSINQFDIDYSNHVNLLQQLGPIKVIYDKSDYATCVSIHQEVSLLEGYNYLITYEYFGSPTYLGVSPKGEGKLFLSEIDSIGEFICSESQLVYLVMGK